MKEFTEDYIVIRRATMDDLRTVQDLNYGTFVNDLPYDPDLNMRWPYEKEGEDYFRSRIAGPDAVCFVAEVDGKPVGYVAGAIRKGEPYRLVQRSELENMYVDENVRRSGVGRALVEELFKWSQEQGITQVFVSAYWGNDRAIEFYKSCGFESNAHDLQANLD